MRKMRTVIYSMALVALLCAAANFAYGQELSAADKERGMQYLETTKKNIVEATKGLSEAQWNFKAAPDRWSVAETMEHIAAAEDLLRGMIVEQGMKAPAEPGRDLKKTDDAVVAMIPDRSHKAQAPEPLKPTNRYGDAGWSGQTFSGEPRADGRISEEHAGPARARFRQSAGDETGCLRMGAVCGGAQ